jgi:branched-chain amino acid transport system substrate-binding protein
MQKRLDTSSVEHDVETRVRKPHPDRFAPPARDRLSIALMNVVSRRHRAGCRCDAPGYGATGRRGRSGLQQAVALLAVVCAVSACGSQSSTSATAVTGATRSAAHGSFTLGMICSCTGAEQSSEGDNGAAIQAWAKWVNAHGGIDGYPVRVIVKDDGLNPATSLEYAKELVTQDHIIAMVGETSLVDSAWATYIESTGVPVVGGVPQEAAFGTNPDFFPSGAGLAVPAGVAVLANSAGKHHLGVFYCAEAPICAQSVPPARAVARRLGMSITAGAIAASAPGYAAPCLAAKGAGVDAVWVADTAPVVQRFAADCRQQGYDPLEVGGLGSATTAWLADSGLNGFLLAANNADTYDTSLPALKSFYAALRQYAPGILTASMTVEKPLTIYAWAGGVLFQKAAMAAHLTPASSPGEVKKGLYELKNETLGGIAPPLTFTPGRPTFVRCYFTVELKDGRFVPLNGSRTSCLSQADAAAVVASAHQ